MKHNKPITTLVHNQQTIKLKHRSKGRKMQSQDNTRRAIKEEIEELDEKPLRHPPSGKSIH